MDANGPSAGASGFDVKVLDNFVTNQEFKLSLSDKASVLEHQMLEKQIGILHA